MYLFGSTYAGWSNDASRESASIPRSWSAYSAPFFAVSFFFLAAETTRALPPVGFEVSLSWTTRGSSGGLARAAAARDHRDDAGRGRERGQTLHSSSPVPSSQATLT